MPFAAVVRITAEISLTELTHQIAASKSSCRSPACLVADCGRIDLLEGVILGVSAGISQLSGVPGLGGLANLFLNLGGIRKIGC